MKLLFLTLLDFESIGVRSIYTDLLREFVRHGHEVYAISPVERRTNQKTHIVKEDNVTILKLKISNMQKTNIIEKGVSTLFIESIFIHGIKKHFSNVKFDFVMYSTPPITFCRVVEYIKNRDRANTYLLLKDIFPQNAVDIGLMSTTGIRGLFYKIFRNKEKKLYAISDRIGCMSQANVDYILKHNPEISPGTVEICPNGIEVVDNSIDEKTRIKLRKKYDLPLEKLIFVYGGNLGKPQGIDFLIRCICSQKENEEVLFLVIGDGTEYEKLERFKGEHKQKNFVLMRRLPKENYNHVMASCDVGMLFLDYRFTIPNFPSRLLDYMAAKLPVLACTDSNTDVGKAIVDGGFGWWCESRNIDDFRQVIKEIRKNDIYEMGLKGYEYLNENYDVKKHYKKIMKNMELDK